MENNTTSRWHDAQREELLSWKRIKEFTESPRGKLFQSWFEWLHELNLPPIDEKDIILDIGCGPQGIIQILPKGIRMGLDPLISEYKGIYQIPGDLHLIIGVGEYLPFKDNAVDFVFMINTLDHVINPKDVLSEIRRVCKNFLILDTNTTPISDRFLMKFRYKDTLDIYHPHKMSAGEIENLLDSVGFKLLDIKTSGSNTRPTFLLNPLITFFKKPVNVEETDTFWHTEGKLHSVIKRYFLNILNFALYRISKRRFADNMKVVASKRS